MDLLIYDKQLDIADRVQLIFAYLLQLSLIGAIIFFSIRQDWLNLVLTAGILILVFIPAILRRSFKVHLPIEVDLLIIIFTYGTLFLGEMHGFYTSFWWWDKALHASSGILFGLVGFLMAYILNEEKRVVQGMTPGFIALFAFSFAIMIGALWEVFEFAMDTFFGFTMQDKGSLADTMVDLILDSFTALLVALVGYFYIRKRHSLFFERFIQKFLARNPHLFRRRKIFQKVIEKVGP